MDRHRLKRNSLFFKLALVLFSIVVMQALIMAAVFGMSGISSTLRNYGYEVFEQQVQSRGDYLLGEMINRWSNITQYKSEIEESYVSSGDTLSFLSAATPILTDVIRSSLSTGAFVILDDAQHEGDSHSCVYLINYNNNTQLTSMSDLNLVKGPSEISVKYDIPLPNEWNYGLSLDEEHREILKNPISTVELTDNDAYRGYWHIAPSPDNPKTNSLTYSLPLVDSTGAPFGVIGTEINADYLSKILPFGDFSETGSYGYGISQLINGEMIPQISLGTIQSSIFSMDEPMQISLVNEEFSTYVTETPIGDIAINYDKLDVYAPNTPFVGDEYYLMGLMDHETIVSFANNANNMIYVEVLVAFIMGLLGAYFLGRRFTRPYVALSAEVRRERAGRVVSLKRTGTQEIDDLSEAIESLSRRLLDSATKTDRILEVLNIGVGSFEYEHNDDRVSVSNSMKKLLEISDGYDENLTANKHEFLSALDELKKTPHEELADVYRAKLNPELWIKITEVSYGSSQLGVLEDVTKDVHERRLISYELNYDTLTGLFNRSAFRRNVTAILDAGNPDVAAILMLDLDNLKYVNDTFGHEYGDMYLRESARVMREVFTENAVIARISGDEFYTFFYGFPNKKTILDGITEMYATLDSSPITMPNGNEFKIRMSAGIAWYQEDSDNFDELMRYADFAMYEGKHTVKGQLRIFNKQAYSQESFMLSGREELNRVLDNQFVEFAFQPIVNAHTGKLYAYEALMRPQSELLNTPLKLLQIATAQSQLWKIERITFFKVMAAYVKNLDKFGDAKIFINSVPNQILRDSEYSTFEDMYGSYLDRIVVEIIETERLDQDKLQTKLNKFDSWGALIALDDYGSGYNSDLNLLNLSPKIIKVDMTIIRGIEQDKGRQALMDKIVSFARQNDILLLGEGVETSGELDYLVRVGVDLLQGYYVSRPIAEPNFDSSVIAEEISQILHP